MNRLTYNSTRFALLLTLLPAITHCHLQVRRGTALELARTIAGRGVTVTSAAFADCEVNQAGIFWDGEFDIEFESGIVLSSAFAQEAEGPNDNNYPFGDVLGRPGSPLLDKLLKPKNYLTKDACTLHIEFDCDNRGDLELLYVFGSDNYPSDGSNPHNDVMGIFLNGDTVNHNIATVHNNGTYVSVNTFYKGPEFIDNQQDTYDTEMNGFSKPLRTDDKARFLAKNGENEIDIVVADGYISGAFDNKKGAWLFIKEDSLKCVGGGGGFNRNRNPGACARRVKSLCRCRDWECIDENIKFECDPSGSPSDVNAFMRKVRKVFKTRLC